MIVVTPARRAASDEDRAALRLTQLEARELAARQPAVFRLAEIFPWDIHPIQFARSEYPSLPDHAGYEFCL